MHLTFQEYLAAWHLSNQEFDDALQRIGPHIRQQKWFEVLQLLGGEWAKQSDEKLDRYLAWLLEQQGRAITDRAPVVALCANIVKDVSGVAELKPQTRQSYQGAVQDTLAAFRPRSGVPDKIQLEILEALGLLGAAVKPYLMDATKSGLYAVRRCAIEMLLPHLSDDELFSLDHILSDRSREPIKTFLTALLARNTERAVAWLLRRKQFEGKACEALGDLIPVFAAYLSSNVLFDFLSNVFQRDNDPLGQLMLRRMMVIQLKDDFRIWQLIDETVTKDPHSYLELIHTAATKDSDWFVRATALELLASEQGNDPATWQVIREAAIMDPINNVRSRDCGLLLDVSNCDELQRRLMLRDFYQPSWYLNEGFIWYARALVWYDPKEPITIRRVAEVARKLSLSIDEVRRQYEELADQLQIALNLEWRKPS